MEELFEKTSTIVTLNIFIFHGIVDAVEIT